MVITNEFDRVALRAVPVLVGVASGATHGITAAMTVGQGVGYALGFLPALAVTTVTLPISIAFFAAVGYLGAKELNRRIWPELYSLVEQPSATPKQP